MAERTDTEELSERDRANLNWMRIINDEKGCGAFGPTLRAYHNVPEFDRLCDLGLASRDVHVSSMRNGYWITAAGRSALENES